MKTRKPLLYHLGNFLIIFSLAILVFIYYPFVQAYLFPPNLKNVPQKGYFVQIPKIKAQAPIILNVDPWNEKEYRSKLKEGIAHAKGTSIPPSNGTGYLFAHSSDYPWSIGKYNTVFFRLNELNLNDEIFIFKDGKKYVYKVKDKKIVWPSQADYLTKG